MSLIALLAFLLPMPPANASPAYVGSATLPTNDGYWLTTAQGQVAAFGAAQFLGDTSGVRLNRPVVAMTSTPSGHGYWLVASDGGIFTFGDALFYGSTGSTRLNQPIVGMAAISTGHGYWLVASDGGIFTFGDARFYGSAVGAGAATTVTMVPDSSGGYTLVRADGTVVRRTADVTSPAPTPTGTPTGWTLVEQEDFNSASLNTNRWGVYSGPGNEGVGLRSASAIHVQNGELLITGTGNVAGGMANDIDQTHGRWEVRARMDKGTGYGPTILLWPQSENWPTDGEIDISEMPEGDRSLSHFTVHYGANNQQISHTDSGDFSQWHTYAVEWTADHINYELDGVVRYTVTRNAAIPTTPMHLALQNDVGADGHWIPARNSSTPAQVSLHVDWVKIYR